MSEVDYEKVRRVWSSLGIPGLPKNVGRGDVGQDLAGLNDHELVVVQVGCYASTHADAERFEAARRAVQAEIDLRASRRMGEEAKALVEATKQLSETTERVAQESESFARSQGWLNRLFLLGATALGALLTLAIQAFGERQRRTQNVPDWLSGGIKYALVAAVLGFLVRWVWHRYQRFTFGDSNSPAGRETDWRGFFGRAKGR